MGDAPNNNADGGYDLNADTSGMGEIAQQLADLSRQIAQENLNAEAIMAPAKAEKSISQKGS